MSKTLEEAREELATILLETQDWQEREHLSNAVTLLRKTDKHVNELT